MDIRQNIFISITIHITVIASVFIISDRIRDTANYIHVNHLMVSLFRGMSARIPAASSTHPLSGLKNKIAHKKEENVREPILNNTITPISDHKDMENKKLSGNNSARTISQIQHTGVSEGNIIPSSEQENDGNNQSINPLNKGGPGGLSVMTAESQGAQDLYASVRNAIDRAKVYPLLARKRKLEGTVIMEFIINNKGYPQDIRIDKSSEHEILDSAAIKTVKNAAPLPHIQGKIIIPIRFKLTDYQAYTYR
jgi:periplasmic protein TonB